MSLIITRRRGQRAPPIAKAVIAPLKKPNALTEERLKPIRHPRSYYEATRKFASNCIPSNTENGTASSASSASECAPKSPPSKNTDSTQSPGPSKKKRQIYHSATSLPKYSDESENDSEAGPEDPEWIPVRSSRLIEDFVDVNEGEKEFMNMWNAHLSKMKIYGACHIKMACSRFIQLHGKEIIDRNLYRNFCLHLVNLFEFDLLDEDEIVPFIQELKAVNNIQINESPAFSTPIKTPRKSNSPPSSDRSVNKSLSNGSSPSPQANKSEPLKWSKRLRRFSKYATDAKEQTPFNLSEILGKSHVGNIQTDSEPTEVVTEKDDKKPEEEPIKRKRNVELRFSPKKEMFKTPNITPKKIDSPSDPSENEHFLRKQRWRHHWWIGDNSRRSPSVEDYFICKICDKVFMFKKSFDCHTEKKNCRRR